MGVVPIGVNHVAFEVRDLDEALAWPIRRRPESDCAG
jgi:hypothetical protein